MARQRKSSVKLQPCYRHYLMAFATLGAHNDIHGTLYCIGSSKYLFYHILHLIDTTHSLLTVRALLIHQKVCY